MLDEHTAGCRRRDCDDPVVARGLCARHWASWQRGETPLQLDTDDRPAPAPQVWQPPERDGSGR